MTWECLPGKHKATRSNSLFLIFKIASGIVHWYIFPKDYFFSHLMNSTMRSVGKKKNDCFHWFTLKSYSKKEMSTRSVIHACFHILRHPTLSVLWSYLFTWLCWVFAALRALLWLCSFPCSVAPHLLSVLWSYLFTWLCWVFAAVRALLWLQSRRCSPVAECGLQGSGVSSCDLWPR